MSTIRGFFKDLSDAISPPPDELGRRLLRLVNEDWVGEKYSLPRIEKLLENGADVSVCDASGTPALTHAVAHGGAALVGMILKKKPPLEAKDTKVGWTALITAAVNGHAKVVQMLLDAGCDIDNADLRGTTALVHATNEIKNKPACADCVAVLQAVYDKRREAERQEELRRKAYESYLGQGMPVSQTVRVLKPLAIVRPAAKRNR